ncbi:DUF6348 family protein [Micromonospora sp. NPDC047074]|uniref:DUF6348 family protein n=1 Tax=Micromonospora sp. NPDC047074 TaxID=3154339 RepID=UPI0033D860BB
MVDPGAVIAAGLGRPYLNGVRMLVGQCGDVTACKISINGRQHEPAAAAFAALDWPPTDRFGLARPPGRGTRRNRPARTPGRSPAALGASPDARGWRG